MFVTSCVAKALSSASPNSEGLVSHHARRPGACQPRQRKRRFTMTEIAQLQSQDNRPDGRLASSPVSYISSASNRIILSFYNLPTELIAMIGDFLFDIDLCTLTRVSRRLRAIGCPQYLRRKGLTSTASGQSLSVRAEGFKALGMWRWSLGFAAQDMLFCDFDFFDANQVPLEMYWLCKFFISLPLQPTIIFRYIRLDKVQTPTLQSSLDLLKITIHNTRCRSLNITGMSFQDGRWWKKGEPKSYLVLEGLEELEFHDCKLSTQQWMSLLSKLRIPSLREFKIVGQTSMEAVYCFLCRHPDLRVIHFRRCLTKGFTSTSGRLKMPLLWSVKGSPSQVLGLLKSLPSWPIMGKLVIELIPATSRPGSLFDQVLRCLMLCRGHIALEVSLSKETSMAVLTLTDVCVPIDLRGATLPCTIITLCIEYEQVCDKSVLMFCRTWMPFLPGLRRVNLAKVEPNAVGGLRILWGRVERTEDGLYVLIWGTKYH